MITVSFYSARFSELGATESTPSESFVARKSGSYIRGAASGAWAGLTLMLCSIPPGRRV